MDAGFRHGRGIAVPATWRPLAPAWIAIAAVTVGIGALRVAGVTVPMRAQLLAYLIGMVAINLPHGGIENLENLRRRPARFQATYAVAFVVLGGAFVGLLFVAPVIGLLAMIGVACAKGGLGGLAAFDAVVGADHLRTRPQRWLAAAVRGSVVMVVPYVAFTGTFSAYSGYMVAVFDPGAMAGWGWLFASATQQAALAVLAVSIAVHVGLGYLRDPGAGTWLADAIETGLLVAYFWTVPVVLAVGLYFPLWYSARQIARGWIAGSDRPTAEGAWLAPERHGSDVASVLNLGVFVAGAALTGLLLAGLYVVAPNPAGGAPSWLAGAVVLYTIFVSVIAFPHVLVGGLLDEQGIWFVP